MKKLFTAMLFGVMVLLGSLTTSEAAEYVNGYEVTVAEDGCRIYTEESLERFAADHKGQNVRDQIFLDTMHHIRHSTHK